MIELFNIPNHKIDTSKFSHLLHGNIVQEFEKNFAEYVGAKYACSANSASSLIYLALKSFSPTAVSLPSTIPVVVPNMVVNAGHRIRWFNDDDWVGSHYHLHENIIDSAQEVTKDQFSNFGQDDALMIFSFYPTKPVSGCDGGIVVSNDKERIDAFRVMTTNGTSVDKDSWKREHIWPGYKMHWTSIQAYIANENLKKINEKNRILDKINAVYNEAFGYNNKSRHLYRIRVKDNKKFLNEMLNEGIKCGIHYEHCHGKVFSPYELAPLSDLSRSEKTSSQTASIPFHEELTNDDISKVIHYAKKYN